MWTKKRLKANIILKTKRAVAQAMQKKDPKNCMSMINSYCDRLKYQFLRGIFSL